MRRFSAIFVRREESRALPVSVSEKRNPKIENPSVGSEGERDDVRGIRSGIMRLTLQPHIKLVRRAER